MPRSLKSLATIYLSLFVTAEAQAQPLVGGVESIECAVANSSLVVIGTIVEVHAKKEADTGAGVEATMLVEETLKGSHGDRRRVRLRRPAADLAGWKERSTRLLVMQDDPKEMDVIDLTDKGLAVFTSDLTLLRKPEDVIRVAKETVRRMPGVTRIETYRLRVPDRATVAGTKWEETYKTGGYIRVAVPIDDRLEKLAIEYVRAKDYEQRREGAILLRYFKSDENVAQAKALLDDPNWGYRARAEENRGVEVRSYDVREMAYSTLNYWGVKVEKPVTSEEVRKPDVVRLVSLSNQKVTDADLKKLASFKNLESLLLLNSGVTDEQLKELAKLANLRDLYLGGTPVTDEGLKHLAALKNLRYLGLGGTAVTDEGLKVLAGFPSLRKIDLDGAKKVTAGGLAELRKLRPDLKEGQLKQGRPPRAEDEVPYSVLKDWSEARVKEPTVVVLTDEAAYTKLFAESFAAFRFPKPVAEKVDFQSKQVVAVCWGARNSTGYGLSAASVTGTPQEITITVKTVVPKGLASPAITYPAVVVVIPKAESVRVIVTGDRLPNGWDDFTDLKKGLEVNVIRAEERKGEGSGGGAKEPKPAADAPVRIEIAADKKEYPFRGAIRLTVTYTNTSKEKVELLASGIAPGEGFDGETFEVTSGAGRTAYAIHAIDPGKGRQTLEPGKSWKRELDLTAVLSGANDGKERAATDPLPDPFGRLDEFKVRLTWKSAVNVNKKPVFRGPTESNVITFRVGG